MSTEWFTACACSRVRLALRELQHHHRNLNCTVELTVTVGDSIAVPVHALKLHCAVCDDTCVVPTEAGKQMIRHIARRSG